MAIEQAIGRYLRRTARQTLQLQSGDTPELTQHATNATRLLYIHIPFCETLCSFCTFHRVQFNADLVARYFVALRAEIKRYCERGFQFNDVYIGGGTPTVAPEELLRTLELIRALGVSGNISVETNPNHLQEPLVGKLIDAGVARLSVGVQSFDNRLLKEMGRFERYGSGEIIAERLQQAQGKFNTLNADLIFNFPHQSVSSLERDIEILHQIAIDQVSFYPLMPATQTRRAMSKQMGEVNFSSEKTFYRTIIEQMQPDYHPSSAWCFSRGSAMIDEYIVDHNEYLGVGSGSFSYVNGTMYSTSFSIHRYIDRIENGHLGMVMHKPFQRRLQLRYALLVNLFGLKLSTQQLTNDLGPGAAGALWKELLCLRMLGAVRRTRGDYELTDRGMYLMVVMMREFLMGVNQFREQMRHHIKLEQRNHSADIVIPVAAINKQP